MILIVFGVSGTGKSTIGYQLAQQLNLPFYDGDDFHPQSNIQRMKNGTPLNDQDRQPWLASLAQHISDWQNEKGAVLACSALKEGYRQTLASLCKTNIQWVLLNGSRELLLERLNSRNDHFFDPQLLDSQLDTLELPDYGWTIDIQKSPSEIINKLLKLLSKD